MTTVFQRVRVGPYEIVHEIGRGGMAVVFFATDSRDDRRVALKLVPIGTDKEGQEIVEAECWGAKLQEQFCRTSRNVPVLYEYGTEGGYFYIAMEYLDGRNLSEVLAAGALAPARATRIAIQLCQFLEAAHGFESTIDGRQLRALLHGDLKPRNIRLLWLDKVKVLDFGIAKALSLSRKLTRNDFGSITYVSPERLESGEIDTYADFWAVGVLLYEMLAGVQPFRASDTRRLELRIRSLQPPDRLGAPCPPPLQAVVAKLLAPHPADRYADARSIREDLESVLAGRVTQAEREGWPGDGMRHDEPATARTQPPPQPDADATRKTMRVEPEPGATALLPANVIFRPSEPDAVARHRAVRRYLRAACLLVASFLIGHEVMIASRAERLKAEVPVIELEDVGGVWERYRALSSQSLRITTARLEDALTNQTVVLADRIIGNYRNPGPAVRETQWKMAREALAQALTVNPADNQVKGALRYCDGHLHRINGDARKTRRQNAEAQREFTEAVSAFREAAELRPAWPDPFLGLMRTFIYGLEDVDRGADALKQAQRLGYTAGDRETVQLADGYRSRAIAFARTARATTRGRAVEQEYLARSAEAYRQAIDLYSKVLGFADAPRSLRAAQRGLEQVEKRKGELSVTPARPDRSPAFRLAVPQAVQPWP